MVTMSGKHPDIAMLIQSMTELEYDAIAAYEAAIERFESKEYKLKLQDFVQDHYRHLEELKSFRTMFNIEKIDGPDMKVVLTKGKVLFANMMGDKAILCAMKTNEDDTVMAYADACKNHENLPETVRNAMQKGLADESRHRTWMMQEIERWDRQAA